MFGMLGFLSGGGGGASVSYSGTPARGRTVTARLSGYTVHAWQWYQAVDDGGSTEIEGETSAEYTIPADAEFGARYFALPTSYTPSRAVTVRPVAPDAPAAPSLTAGDERLTLTLSDAPANGGSEITQYRYAVFLADDLTDPVAEGTVAPADLAVPIDLSPVTNGLSYVAYWAAQNSVGWSEWSAASSPATPAVNVLPALNEPRTVAGTSGVMSGASHSDRSMSAWTAAIAAAASGESAPTWHRSTRPGTGLPARWDEAYTATNIGPENARELVETGAVDFLSITHTSGAILNATVYDRAALFRDACEDNDVLMFIQGLNNVDGLFADETGPLYNEDPAQIPTGTWEAFRDQQIEIGQKWQGFTEFLRTSQGVLAGTEEPARYVPWPEVLAHITNEWLAGNAPAELQYPSDLLFAGYFGDNHPNDIGRWLICMTLASVVYRRSPVGASSPTAVLGSAPSWDTLSAATWDWFAEQIWHVVEREPLADVRAWNATPDFTILTSPGQIDLYRTPTLDPADPPADFTATLRVADDENSANWIVQSGLSSVPVTWTGLDTGEYQVRSDGGQWSDPVEVNRVVPEDVGIVSVTPFYDGADGTTLSEAEDALVVSTPEAQPGDVMLWIGLRRSSERGAFYYTGFQPAAEAIQADFPERLLAADYGDGGNSLTVHVLARTIDGTEADSYSLSNTPGGTSVAGTVFVLRGADIDRMNFSELVGEVGTGKVVAPSLTVEHDASLVIGLMQTRANVDLLTPDERELLAELNDFDGTMRVKIFSRHLDAGVLDRPDWNFMGAGGTTKVRGWRVAIGPKDDA